MMQNAQMHQMVMQKLMLGQLPGSGPGLLGHPGYYDGYYHGHGRCCGTAHSCHGDCHDCHGDCHDHCLHVCLFTVVDDCTLMRLNIGTPKTINFPFVPNGKLIVFGCLMNVNTNLVGKMEFFRHFHQSWVVSARQSCKLIYH